MCCICKVTSINNAVLMFIAEAQAGVLELHPLQLDQQHYEDCAFKAGGLLSVSALTSAVYVERRT